ncbi:MAG: hypothetical protein IPL95_13715 [Saprospiraceae bacterium]|nr:hypothetical protein [Saprospiraceae bacterium]
MKITYTNLNSIIGFKTLLLFCGILLNFNLYSQCNSQLAYWNFDDCTAGNMVKDGTLPSQSNNGGCSSITTSISRIDPANSCVDRGNGNKANCFGQNAIPTWVDNSPKAVVTTVSFPSGSSGKLSGMMFTIAVHNLVDWNNQPNHYPTKWGIRVVKNGNQIFKQIDIPFTPDVWTPINFDWSSNTAFQVSGATTFKIELLAYAPGTVNSSSNYEVWELDDVKVLGGCCTLPSNCNLTSPSLTGVTCKNNNTSSNPLDDYIEFKLNPTGTGIGTQYKVTVNGGATVTPSQASYGSVTTFRLQNGSAGSGNKIITISDKTNPNCSIMVNLTDPGTCSSIPPCNITATGLNNITCNNNGTSTDNSDDKVVFSLNPIGTGLSSSYSVYINGSSVMPSSANYGTNTIFMLPAGSAGNGPWIVTVKDNLGSSTCSISFILIDPGTCSTSCQSISYPLCSGESYTMTVSTSNITNIQWQKNIGGVWTNILGETGNSFTTNSIGIYRYIAFDLNNCNIELCCPFVIVEGNCPNSCSIISDGLSNVACNSNSTNTDPSDDFVTFSLNPSGIGLGGTQYNIASSTGTISPTFGIYGSPTLFTLSNGTAGNGNITITITDAVYTTCSKSINLTNPGVCSCSLTNLNLSNPECSNNGTSLTNDDFIKFSLNPDGILGESYSVNVSSVQFPHHLEFMVHQHFLNYN